MAGGGPAARSVAKSTLPSASWRGQRELAAERATRPSASRSVARRQWTWAGSSRLAAHAAPARPAPARRGPAPRCVWSPRRSGPGATIGWAHGSRGWAWGGVAPVAAARPGRQALGAQVGVAAGAGAGPLAQRGLDGPLGLAVGSKRVRPGAQAPGPQPPAQPPEAARAAAGAVVGHDAPEGDAEAGEAARRPGQGAAGAAGPLVGGDGGEAGARGVAGGGMRVLLSRRRGRRRGARARRGGRAGGSAQLLDVQVKQVAGPVPHAPVGRGRRAGRRQAVGATAPEGPRDRAHARAHALVGVPVGGPPPADGAAALRAKPPNASQKAARKPRPHSLEAPPWAMPCTACSPRPLMSVALMRSDASLVVPPRPPWTARPQGCRRTPVRRSTRCAFSRFARGRHTALARFAIGPGHPEAARAAGRRSPNGGSPRAATRPRRPGPCRPARRGAGGASRHQSRRRRRKRDRGAGHR